MMDLEKSKTLKRRLRRERIAMEKVGDFVPFTPRSEPLDTKPDDQPKLTNHAKRAARKRKKKALWQQEVEDICSGSSSKPTVVLPAGLEAKKVSNKIKSKKRKKRSKIGKDVDATISNDKGTSEDNSKSTTPATIMPTGKKHLRFDEEEEEEEESPVISDDKDTSSVTTGMPPNGSELVDTDVVGGPIETNGEEAGDKDTPSDLSKEIKKDNLPPKKRRFVLFVGNLSYETKEADVMEHFKKVGSIVSVRIAKHKDSNTCRGFCHLEVGDEETYLKALGLHHTFMAKRRINVEYSSGQSEEKGEIKRKNFKLQTLNKTGRLGGSKFHPYKSVNSKVKTKPAEKVRGAFFV